MAQLPPHPNSDCSREIAFSGSTEGEVAVWDLSFVAMETVAQFKQRTCERRLPTLSEVLLYVSHPHF